MLRPNTPVVLTIAGSDSGGEAGIQADLKTFAAFKVHGVTAITCLTAQNPGRISRVESCSPMMLRAQLEAVADHFKIGAAKTGMLYSGALVDEVVKFFRKHRDIPLVVDPVMVSSSGRALLDKPGVKKLMRELLPLATIVTPNVAEAQILTGRKIRKYGDLGEAAAHICSRYGCAALVKGGHLPRTDEAIDFLCSADAQMFFSALRIKNARLHGTGCTYSAALAACLAQGKSLTRAVSAAKQYISKQINHANS